MLPTSAYHKFRLAKERNQAVAILLSGKLQPLSAMEEYLWNRFEMATRRFEQQAK